MIITSEITARITMDVPGRFSSKYDMIEGTINIEGYESTSFKCLYTAMDGMYEIDTQFYIVVAEKDIYEIQKYVVENLFGQTDFQQWLDDYGAYANLYLPGQIHSIPTDSVLSERNRPNQ